MRPLSIALFFLSFFLPYTTSAQTTEKWLIEPKYDGIGSFRDGLAPVSLNGKWGFIDKTGKEIIPLEYDEVEDFNEGLAQVKGNNTWIFIDKIGTEIIFIYDFARPFHEGLAAVRLNGKWGFINKTYKEIISLKYDDVFSFDDGLAIVQRNDKWGFIDKTGREIIPPKYYSVSFFHESLAGVKLNDKWGFIDRAGKEIISPKYDGVSFFHEGLAAVELYGKRGFIDKTGKVIIPMKYDGAYFFNEGFAAVKRNGKWGFIDKTGQEIIPPKYDDVSLFDEGLAAVKRNGKWGFINKIGQEIIPLKYEIITPKADYSNHFHETFQLKVNKVWGFTDKTGEEVLPLEDEEARFYYIGYHNPMAVKTRFLGAKKDKEIYASKYILADFLHEGLAAVALNGKCGFIDKMGKEIIPLKYDEVSLFHEGLAAVKRNDKLGFIDKTGKEIIPLKYDNVDPYFYEGLAGVSQNGKWGIIYLPNHVKFLDRIPPIITVTEPKNLRGVAPIKTQESQILVKGTVTDVSGIKSLLVNGQAVTPTTKGAFSHTLTLANGSNALWIEAEDTYSNKAQVQYAIERQAVAPNTSITSKATFGTYHALLIAVKDYQDPLINDLQQPIADAAKVRQSLLNRYTFLPKNITLLSNPTLKQLADTLSKYRRQLTAQDNLLILFCGHGQYDKEIEQGYWLLSDAQTGSPTTWLSNASLRDYLRGIKTQHTLIVSDACFSGSLLLRNSPSIDAATVPIQEIHKLSSRRGITSGALTTVPDESVFIEYFLNRLNTNPKPFLPSQELFNSFYQDVIQQTKFVPQSGGISGTGDDGGDFIFVKK